MRLWIAGSTATMPLVLLLAAGQPTSGGNCSDTDWDGVGECSPGVDNCVLVPNGPLLGTWNCDDQEDGDMDGYGNPCDTDTNNNGATDAVDLAQTASAASVFSTNLSFDFNCNGAADAMDIAIAASDAAVFRVPGPSGYACAGTIPCP